MGAAASLILALGLMPAFQPEPTFVPHPLMWETPISWSAPDPVTTPPLDLSPSQIERVKEVQKILREQGPTQAADHLAKSAEQELILFRAGLRREAGDLKSAQADYEKVMQSKNRTAPGPWPCLALKMSCGSASPGVKKSFTAA